MSNVAPTTFSEDMGVFLEPMSFGLRRFPYRLELGVQYVGL